jgi:multidrug efflux system outer membrane protein
LEETIRLAIERNPIHLSVLEQEEERRAAIREVKASAYPSITFSSSYSRTRSPSLLNSKDFESFLEQFPEGFSPSVQPMHTLNVEINQPIYTFGRIKSAVELAKVVQREVEARTWTSRLDVAHTAGISHIAIVTAIKNRDMLRQDREVRQETLQLVERRYQLGEATKLEWLRAKATLAELQPAVLQAEHDVVLAELALKKLLNLPLDRELSVALTLPSVSEEMTREGNTTLAPRPELLELQEQINSLQQQATIQRSFGLPSLDFRANYGREALYLENVLKTDFRNWNAAVEFSWHVYDGGERKAKIAQIQAQIRQLTLRQQDLIYQIKLEVTQARKTYQTALAELHAAKTGAAVSAEAFHVAELSYREGVALHNDLLDAQQQALSANTAVLQAELAVARSVLDLYRAHGTWMPSSEDTQGATTP